MKISVNGQHISILEEEELVQNSENIYPVEFEFDESWEGFLKIAVFMAGYTRVPISLTDDRCNLPSQCLKRAGANIKISVTGICGDKKMPTTWCKTRAVVPGSGSGQAGSSSGGDAYLQLAGTVGDVSALQTKGKSIVDAINELVDTIESGAADEKNTATDEEVDQTIDDIFGPGETGAGSGGETESGHPGSSEGNGDDEEDEPPGNTATDEEVDDLLEDVFG